jgi:SAM-dependent methyltransferase
MELLLGCGNSRRKIVYPPWAPPDWVHLVTLDIDPACGADVIHDLDATPWPFEDNTFDEIHAYEVLEHFGQQGDYHAFFRHFGEIYRVLKPKGLLCGTSPAWDRQWAWSDPGHRRIVSPQALGFLDQSKYTREIGVTTMTDYRWLWKGDLRLLAVQRVEDSDAWILQAHKPATV